MMLLQLVPLGSWLVKSGDQEIDAERSFRTLCTCGSFQKAGLTNRKSTKGWQAGVLGGSSTITLSMSFSFCLRGSSYIMANDSSRLTG